MNKVLISLALIMSPSVALASTNVNVLLVTADGEQTETAMVLNGNEPAKVAMMDSQKILTGTVKDNVVTPVYGLVENGFSMSLSKLDGQEGAYKLAYVYKGKPELSSVQVGDWELTSFDGQDVSEGEMTIVLVPNEKTLISSSDAFFAGKDFSHKLYLTVQ